MRLIDADDLEKQILEYYQNQLSEIEAMAFVEFLAFIDDFPTVEAIPKEEVRQFIENIQKIKDNHNEHGEPINYGTICGILIEGYRLLDKYMEGKDGNDD